MNESTSLFEDDLPPQIHDNFDGVSGLRYHPQVLSPSEQTEILREIDSREWQSDLKRRVQHYGYKYDYKARAINPSMYVGPLPQFAIDVGAKLQSLGLMPAAPDQLIVNEYQPGQGIALHVDCEPCFKDAIATVSLGWVYPMMMKHVDTDDKKEITLALGSCLVFTSEARYDWRHGIRARKADHGIPRQRRVSLTFRNVNLNS